MALDEHPLAEIPGGPGQPGTKDPKPKPAPAPTAWKPEADGWVAGSSDGNPPRPGQIGTRGPGPKLNERLSETPELSNGWAPIS